MSRFSMWVVRIAAAVAFFVGGLMIAAPFLGYGQILLIPASAIPLGAGIGILRKRRWGAYGFALYLGGQLLLAAFLASRETPNVIPSAIFLILFVALFFFAGRALAAAGGKPGWAAPWIVVTALFTLPILFVQAFAIPSAAMEDTLVAGDRILVQRYPRPELAHDEIVVFSYPLNRQETYIKRLIGMPGDLIRISNKTLYRNGIAQNEAYAVHKTGYVDSYRDNFPNEPNTPLPAAALEMLQKQTVNGELVVPNGKYFVLGDNRDDSADSRYWGFVENRDMIGKPLLIYDSEEQSAEDLTSERVPVRRRIRWERLFKVVK